MGMLALGASAAPADMGDANIYTLAHLYSFGTHGNGDGPELADCMIATTAYNAFYSALTKEFAAATNIRVQAYSSYPSKKTLLLIPNADDAHAAEIFIQTCADNGGAPHKYH